jgi:hypothetical protein
MRSDIVFEEICHVVESWIIELESLEEPFYLAREHGIDVAKIKDSGPSGRIARDDVMRQIEEGKAVARLQPELEHPYKNGRSYASRHRGILKP